MYELRNAYFAMQEAGGDVMPITRDDPTFFLPDSPFLSRRVTVRRSAMDLIMLYSGDPADLEKSGEYYSKAIELAKSMHAKILSQDVSPNGLMINLRAEIKPVGGFGLDELLERYQLKKSQNFPDVKDHVA